MLDEQHINAFEHLQAYFKRRHHSYNDNVFPSVFNTGDLILCENKCNINANPIEKGKSNPNWLGPYIINESYVFGAYALIELDETPLKDPINVSHLH